MQILMKHWSLSDPSSTCRVMSVFSPFSEDEVPLDAGWPGTMARHGSSQRTLHPSYELSSLLLRACVLNGGDIALEG